CLRSWMIASTTLFFDRIRRRSFTLPEPRLMTLFRTLSLIIDFRTLPDRCALPVKSDRPRALSPQRERRVRRRLRPLRPLGGEVTSMATILDLRFALQCSRRRDQCHADADH